MLVRLRLLLAPQELHQRSASHVVALQRVLKEVTRENRRQRRVRGVVQPVHVRKERAAAIVPGVGAKVGELGACRVLVARAQRVLQEVTDEGECLVVLRWGPMLRRVHFRWEVLHLNGQTQQRHSFECLALRVTLVGVP